MFSSQSRQARPLRGWSTDSPRVWGRGNEAGVPGQMRAGRPNVGARSPGLRLSHQGPGGGADSARGGRGPRRAGGACAPALQPFSPGRRPSEPSSGNAAARRGAGASEVSRRITRAPGGDAGWGGSGPAPPPSRTVLRPAPGRPGGLEASELAAGRGLAGQVTSLGEGAWGSRVRCREEAG